MSMVTSDCGRCQFSVENAYKVRHLIPSSRETSMISFDLSAPRLCPSILGRPRCSAHLPFPSIIIPTCAGILPERFTALPSLYRIYVEYAAQRVFAFQDILELYTHNRACQDYYFVTCYHIIQQSPLYIIYEHTFFHRKTVPPEVFQPGTLISNAFCHFSNGYPVHDNHFPVSYRESVFDGPFTT